MNKDLESYAWELARDCSSANEMIEILSMQKGFQPEDAWGAEMIWNEYWSKHQEGCLDCDCH